MPFLDSVTQELEVELCERKEWNILKGTHFHNCYELYYLAEGEINYLVEGNLFRMQKGDIILIPPNWIHKTMPGQKQRHKRILIYLKPSFLEEFLKYNPSLLEGLHQIKLSPPNPQRAEHLLNRLLAEYRPEMDLVMVKCLLGELLCLLQRWSRQEEALPAEKLGNSKILEVVRYLNASYAEDIRLDETAKRFYLNPSYLSRAFQKVMGISFTSYLTKIRIKHALELLSSTECSVTEISLGVGFHSTNHFCKCFQSEMGMSALQYRKREQS